MKRQLIYKLPALRDKSMIPEYKNLYIRKKGDKNRVFDIRRKGGNKLYIRFFISNRMIIIII